MSDPRPRTDFRVAITPHPEGAVLISSLTGRRVTFNSSEDTFLVLADADVGCCNVAISDLLAYWHQRFDADNRPDASFRMRVYELTAATSITDLANVLQALLASCAEGEWRKARPRITEVLFALWAAGGLAFPRSYMFTKFPEVPTAPIIWNRLGGQIATLAQTFKGMRGNHWPLVMRMISRIGSVQEIGDVPASAIRAQTEVDDKEWAAKFRMAADRLRRIHAQMYGAAAEKLTAADYAVHKERVLRLDKSFEWCVQKDPSLAMWKTEAVAFIEGSTKGHAGKVTGINAFLDFLVDHPEQARDPIALVRGGQLPRDYRDWLLEVRNFDERSENLSRYINIAHSLLESVISRHWVDDGIVAPGIRNPIAREGRASVNRVRTNRRALPSYILRRITEIIVEDDFAWPKTLAQDYIQYIEPDGTVRRVWSPVRAIALLVKLHLPLRTFQVRMLNSGEADVEVYRPELGGWVQNAHALAGTSSRAMGAIRRFEDKFAGVDFPGFYINTNKTQDTNLKTGRGYEIP